LAGAVNNLAASTEPPLVAPSNPSVISPSPQPATIPAAPEPKDSDNESAKAASSNSVTIANKKIIHPPEHEPRPDINELLARQQEKDVAEAGFGPVMTTPAPIVASDASAAAGTPSLPPTIKPGGAISPNVPATEPPQPPLSMPAAAPPPPEPDNVETVSPSPQEAAAQNAFDPNSIAL
jgi:hypothetical protein